MNYIELINHFWEKDAQIGGFTDREITLYFHILKISNNTKWENPIGISNTYTMARFGWGRHALNTAKNRLKQAGLIDFTLRKGRGRMYQYTLIGTKQTPNRSKINSKYEVPLKPLPESQKNGSQQRKAEIVQRASIAIESYNKRYT